MSDVERVKDAIRIEQYIGQYVELKRASNLYKTCCPHHTDKTPSFIVNPENQSWHCYGACGDGGDVIAFAMKHHNLSFGEALEELARYAGITLVPLSAESKAKEDKRARLYGLLETTARWYASAIPGDVFRYLTDKRGFSLSTIQMTQIGYAPPEAFPLTDFLFKKGFNTSEMIEVGLLGVNDDAGKTTYAKFRSRIMIPIYDTKGRVCGFSGRATLEGQTPKYYNSQASEIFDKSSLLYVPKNKATLGAKNRQGATIPHICVLEGHMDAISALNRDIENCVASMGVAFTESHLTQLARQTSKIIFCFDNDTAGKTATDRLGSHLQSAARLGVELFVMSSPYGKDPDDTFRQHPELWQGAVDVARPVVDVLIEMSIGADPQNMSGTQKSILVKKALKFLRNDDPLVTSENLRKLAAALHESVSDIETMERRTDNLTLLPRNTHIKPTISHLPTVEEWVLHGLIVNDDQKWLERANARLLTVSDRPLPYALRPLNLNDFTQDKTRKIWSMIAELVKANARPFFHQLEVDVKDTSLQEMYERLQRLDITARELGYPCLVNYETFIDHVYQMRMSWLNAELKSLDAPKEECLMAIALLNLAQEELV